MDVSPAKKSYFTCVNIWWKLLFHSTAVKNMGNYCKFCKKVLDDSLRQWYSKQAVARNCF